MVIEQLFGRDDFDLLPHLVALKRLTKKTDAKTDA
jgi:hypothetical protein